MKKSKIIIPAAAILALSVGASVTGTVAWFTASSRVSVTANNLAVINAQGALSVSNTALYGCTASASAVKLEYLQDASYDYINDKAFVAVLDTDGENVVGSREVSKASYRSVNINGVEEPQKVYYVSQWESTFTTTSNETQYLFFDNTSKSAIRGGIEDAEIYKALRVSMVCKVSESITYRILWAPYTGETTLVYLKNAVSVSAADIHTPSAVLAAFEAVSDSTGSVEKVLPQSNIKEGDAKSTATNSPLLLSTALSKASPVAVKTTVWFEGLDSSCLDTMSGINTTTAATMKKVLDLSYYAVAEASLTTI